MTLLAEEGLLNKTTNPDGFRELFNWRDIDATTNTNVELESSYVL